MSKEMRKLIDLLEARKPSVLFKKQLSILRSELLRDGMMDESYHRGMKMINRISAVTNPSDFPNMQTIQIAAKNFNLDSDRLLVFYLDNFIINAIEDNGDKNRSDYLILLRTISLKYGISAEELVNIYKKYIPSKN